MLPPQLMKGKRHMEQVRWFRAFGLAAIALMASLTLAAQGDLAAIQQKLNAQFKLTTTTPNGLDIALAGADAVVELHKDGLKLAARPAPLMESNTYKDGKIGGGDAKRAWGGFGVALLQVTAAAADTRGTTTCPDSIPGHTAAAGEKFWVVAATAQKDGINFKLYTDADDNGIRYHANLKVLFPNKKQVPPVDAAMQLVAEVLTVVPQDNQGEQGGQPAAEPAAGATPSPEQEGPPPPIPGEYTSSAGSRLLLLSDGSFTKFVGGGQGHGQYAIDGNNVTLTFPSTGFSQQYKIQRGNLLDVNTQQGWARTGDAPEAAPAPMPDIAPPPLPTDALAPMPAIAPPPPPAVSIGQTMNQVTAGFGEPLKVANLGGKTIFYYKDMKVTFTNGKVSDVE